MIIVCLVLRIDIISGGVTYAEEVRKEGGLWNILIYFNI